MCLFPPPKTTIIIDLHFIECPKGRQTDRRTERRCVIQVTIFPFPKWGGGGNATEAVMQSYAIESNTLEIDSIRSNEYCSFVCSLEWHALSNMYVCVHVCAYGTISRFSDQHDFNLGFVLLFKPRSKIHLLGYVHRYR